MTATQPAVVLLMLAAGCGARSELGSDEGGGEEALACPSAGEGGCGPVSIAMDTAVSCTIGLLPGHRVDVEGRILVEGQTERILTMDRFGCGHLAVWCDSTRNAELLDGYDMTGYLGQTEAPRVASLGYDYLCDPGLDFTDLEATYLGAELPVEYRDDSAALAADWDVIVFCGYGIPWSQDGVELVDFVHDHGKGLLLAMDYYQSPGGLADGGGISDLDRAQVNALLAPAGVFVEAERVEEAPLEVDRDCVADAP